MDLNPSSQWNVLLESIKPHIPSIDSDFSSSDNEEHITIFRRPAVVSLSQEDLQCLSLEDAELEKQSACWSDETYNQSVKYEGEALESTAVAQRGTQHTSTDVETDACKNKPNAFVKPHLDNKKCDEGFPVLSFALLDQWDLDDILQTLGGDGLSAQGCLSGERTETHAEGDNERSQGDIMERLVTFCTRQSSGVESEPVSQSEFLHSPPHIRPNSAWSKSESMAAELQLSRQECTTVYIDLRCPDPLITTPRTCLGISSESKTPAKHSSHQDTPPAKKPNLRVPPGSRMGDREVTGKSMLLRKLREMNGNESKHFNKYTDPHDSVLEIQGEELKDKPPQPLVPTCRHNLLLPWKDKQSSPVQPEPKRPVAERTFTQQRTTKQPKQLSYQEQRQQVKQTSQQHQHILKELETHRPTKSVNDKQQAAEKTDVLYDIEASHLQAINILPADIENKECVLLTVSLSSLCMVAGRNQGKAQNLDSAITKSHIYNVLVAWFLSLVGPSPWCNEDEASADVPFWVAGLQQLWREDGLALHVFAVSRGGSPQHSYKSRKRSVDTHHMFHHCVCRFLSQTSLSVIAHWLPQLKILLDQQAYASAIHLPSSCLNCFITVNSDKTVIDRIFGLGPGFYWQTVETQEPICQRAETMPTQQLHTEVAFALGYKALFLQPLVTHYTLQLLLNSGLDVSGLRLLYPPGDSAGGVPNIQESDEACQPVLALAVRGPHACSVWQDLTGPSDPLLAKKTDPASINALHCKSKDLPLFYSPRLAQVHRDLCLWFSGRLQVGSPQNHNQALNNRVVPPGDGVGGSLSNSTRSSATLCATTKADMLLVVSPVVAACCYSRVLAVCERRGFSLKGLQRLQIFSKWAKAFGLSSQQVLVFCNPPTVTLDQEEVELSSHCLVLLLRKENVLRHCTSLPAALMREFEAQKLVGCIRSRLNGVKAVQPSCCFHILPYSNSLLNNFVRCMWAVPEPSSVVLSSRKLSKSSSPDIEQVVIFTLCGKDMSQGLSLLHNILTGGAEDDVEHAGYELLGLKWLPTLTRLQAQELSPYEVGDRLWHGSLVSLMSSPALVCALRRVDAFASLRKLLAHDYPGNLSVLMSPTPELAFRQATLFFTEGEMIPDHSARPLLKFLPRTCSTTGSLKDPQLSCMVQGPQMLLTLCLFKPKVWNHALAKILRKVQLSGFTLVGLHMVTLDESHAASLVSIENDPSDFEAHVQYLCSGPSLALCLQRENAVKRLLDVLGPEDQDQARVQDQFLWRACYSMGYLHSGIYGSGSYQRAIDDVKRLFPGGLCCTETNTMRQEQILCMCSDPVASLVREQSHTLTPVAKDRASLSLLSGLHGGSLINSALCQTTCLLLPLNRPPLSQATSHLDLLEQLLRSGCHLVAGRMTVLDEEQRQHIAEILVLPSTRNGKECLQMAHLHVGPCLVIALQRDNVICFDLILESIYRERSELEKVGEMIIHPSTEKQAKQLICYLFDVLSPESYHAIVPQESNMQPS